MSSILIQDIGLRPSQLKAVQKKARHAGTTTPEYVRQLIERDLLAEKTFDEIAEPIRQTFKSKGVTESQLDALVKKARGRRTR